MNRLIIIFLFTLHLVCSDDELTEGSECEINDNETGVCTYIEGCEYAQNRIKNRKKVRNCFFRGSDRYVCCLETGPTKPEQPKSVKPTTTLPTKPEPKPPVLATTDKLVDLNTKGVLKGGDIECRFNGTFPVICCGVVHGFTALRFDEPDSCEELEKPSARHPLTPHQSVIYDACYAYSRLGSKCEKDEDYGYKRDRCEKFKTTTKISDGDPAQFKEFPHMAVTGAKKDNAVNITWIGGGSLISEYYILTAAHAIGSSSYGLVRYALLGTLYKNDTRSGELYYVVKRIKHPKYNPATKENDIAIFRLHTRVTFSDFIRPACLPFPGYDPKEHLTRVVAGWGAIGQKQSNSDVLLKATLHQENDHSKCAKNMTGRRFVWHSDTMLCAKSGSERQGQDSCQGDSGGPLMAAIADLPCSYFVSGIVSWGGECGVGGYGSYTNTSNEKYQEWIVETVWPLEVAARKITLY